MIVVTARDSKAARKTRALLPTVTQRNLAPKILSAAAWELTRARREIGTHGALDPGLKLPTTKTGEGDGAHG